jgi:hypothetical protein
MASRRQQVSQLAVDIRDLINTAARFAAVEIMNDLAEAGPVWGGEFQDSWIAIPIGTGASGSTGGGYPYKLNDVPRLSTSIKETARVKKFEIVNTTSYAAIALDLEPGEFKKIGRPAGDVVNTGTRSNGIRGNVSGDGDAESTAPLDWYITYLNGGGMTRALERGVTFGFRGK